MSIENMPNDDSKNKFITPLLTDMDKQLALFMQSLNPTRALDAMAKSNVIGEGALNPMEWKFLCLTPIPIKLDALTKEGLDDKTTDEVMQALTNQDRIRCWSDKRLAKVAAALQINPGSMHTEGDSNHFDQLSNEDRIKIAPVLDNLTNLTTIHDDISVELLFAHLYLDIVAQSLAENNKTKKNALLLLKKQFEYLVLGYNLYDPYYMPLLEEQRLHQFREIRGLIYKIKAFLITNNVIRNAPPPPNPTLNPKEQSAPAAPQPVLINIGKVTQEAEKVHDAWVETQVRYQNSSLVKTPQAHICLVNLENPMDPAKELGCLETALDTLITKGLNVMKDAKDRARNLNFNLSTMQFGSVANAGLSERYDQVREAIRRFMPMTFKMLTPKIFIVDEISKQVFHKRFFFGRIIYANSLAPLEKITFRIKITETTKEQRETTRTVFESYSETLQNELTESSEKEKNDMNSKDTTTEEYLNTAMNYGAEMSTPIITTGGEYSKDTSNSGSVHENRSESLRKTDNIMKKKGLETTVKRDITVADTSKESTEKTEESGTVRTIPNINETAALILLIRQLMEEFVIISSISDTYVLYHDGSKFRRHSINETNFMLKKNVADQDEQNNILQAMLEVGRVYDYKDREIQRFELLLEKGTTGEDSQHPLPNIDPNTEPTPVTDSEGTMAPKDEKNINKPPQISRLKVRNKTYREFLEEKKEWQESDEIFKHFEPKGIVIQKPEDRSIQSNGIAFCPMVSDGIAADFYAKNERDVAVLKRMAEQELLLINVDTLRQTLTHVINIESIPDRTEAFFKLLKDYKEIFDKVLTLNVLNDNSKKDLLKFIPIKGGS